MNEEIIRGLMITVVYPAMIVATAWGFILLLNWAEKYQKTSKKSVHHRIRK